MCLINEKMNFPSINKYLHNPYQGSDLVFLSQHWNTSNETSQQDKNSIDAIMWDMNSISMIEISPDTLNPILSLALILPIQLLFAISAIFIQLRTLEMLKKENSVNNSLMVTQARLHIIFWPSIVVFNTLIDNIYPVAAIVTPLFCTVLSFYFYFCVFSMILYSFYAAFLRYLCCCYTEKVNNFGKGRIIALIYWTFYLHTFAWALYTIVTQYNLDHIPLLNSCYGYQEEIFLMESTRLNMARRHLCLLESIDGMNLNRILLKNNLIIYILSKTLSPFLISQYFSGNIPMLKTALCAINTLMVIIVLFNMPEFFFYRAIYKFEMR